MLYPKRAERLVRCPEAGHEIESYSAKNQEKEQWNSKSQHTDERVVAWMVDAKCLQHRPEPVAQVYCQRDKGEDIE